MWQQAARLAAELSAATAERDAERATRLALETRLAASQEPRVSRAASIGTPTRGAAGTEDAESPRVDTSASSSGGGGGDGASADDDWLSNFIRKCVGSGVRPHIVKAYVSVFEDLTSEEHLVMLDNVDKSVVRVVRAVEVSARA